MKGKSETCALCNSEVFSHPILEGIHTFCCAGCRAVFNILSAKNQLGDFEQHPIFLQALRSGLISNPTLLDAIQRQKTEIREGEREKLYVEVGEMWCPSCAEIIKLMLLKEKGVIHCVVDYATDLASIEFSPRYTSKGRLLELISKLGYAPLSLDSAERKPVSMDLYLRFAVAAFCALNAMMFAYPLYATYFDYDGEGYGPLFAWLSFAISLPVIFYSAWPIWRRFFNSMRTGVFGMETLVFIGVGSAFIFSTIEIFSNGTIVYFDSMSVIIAFVLLGKIIEAKAKFSAKESLMRLTRSTPKRGRKRFPDGSLRFVLAKEIAKGDLVVIYAGERAPLDALVTEGCGACDESLMTGEALPIAKKAGDGILGGTILVQGQLTCQVINSMDETALHQIIQMIEQDIGHKGVYVRAADQIVRWFVPAVLAIALGVWLAYLPHLEIAFFRALAVLLISCPCAIGIAAPAAESHLLNRLASIGVIVRNRGCLPYLGKETVMVFDKTGTVTEGCYTVHCGLEELTSEDRSGLYSLASLSIHPVAGAIARSLAAGAQKPVDQMEEIVGFGIKGEIDGDKYFLGSARFLQQEGILLPAEAKDQPSEAILSAAYFAKNNQCVAKLMLGDQVRPEAATVISGLKPIKTILLSGDNEQSVAAVARLCGFNSWQSSVTPLEKREVIAGLKAGGETVCMVGDGMNDAPALTAAHIAISVVSATDMSIQVSDLLLTSDKLSIINQMREIARKGHKILKQNLFWAFFYNIVGIVLAVFGVLSPVFAAFAMAMSSLTVLFNAQRLKE